MRRGWPTAPRPRLASERVSIRTVAEDQRSLNNNLGPAGPLPLPGGAGGAAPGRPGRGQRRARAHEEEDGDDRGAALPGRHRRPDLRRLPPAGGGPRPGRQPSPGAAIGVVLQSLLPRLFRGMLPVDVAFAPAARRDRRRPPPRRLGGRHLRAAAAALDPRRVRAGRAAPRLRARAPPPRPAPHRRRCSRSCASVVGALRPAGPEPGGRARLRRRHRHRPRRRSGERRCC